MSGIFLSYRRSDSTDTTGRIYDRLVSDLGKESVFKDVDSIPLGTDFRTQLNHVLGRCQAVLVVVGVRWLEAQNAAGMRRLDDPDDFVRLALEAALARGIPVIPVLVAHATMPTEAQLPPSLVPFAYRQATVVRPDPNFHRDMDRLIAALRGVRAPPARRTGRVPAIAGAVAALALVASVAWWLSGRSTLRDPAEDKASFPVASPGQWPSSVAASRPRLSTGAPASANAEANRYFENAMLREGVNGDVPQARTLLARALELDPHFAEARAWHGFSTWQLLDLGYSNDRALLTEAEGELRRALQDDPSLAQAHMGFAAIFLTQGRKDLVPREVELALNTNPNGEGARHWLMQYHHFKGDNDAARRVAQTNLDLRPLFFPARMMLGEMLRQEGDPAAAIQEQEKILEQDPQHPYALRYLARACMDSGDLLKARRTFDRLRPQDLASYWTRLYRGILAALEGNPAEALKEMDEEVLKWGALVALRTAEVAECYAALGDTSNALDWLDRAVRSGDERTEYFRRNPLFANIREHPRFQQIMESIAYARQQRATSPPR